MANNYNNLSDLFTATANAIRNKTGSTDTIVADDFPEVIEGMRIDDVYYVTFMSDDGTTELYKRPVADGDDCADPVVRELIPTPTKEATYEYEYSYLGWATSEGGESDENALKEVNEDRAVYAAYDVTKLVWYYRGLIERTIESYSDDELTVIEDYAFCNCTNLASVSFPMVTDVGVNAFYDSELTIAEFPNLVRVGDHAFSNSGLTAVPNMSKITSVGRDAFLSCRLEGVLDFSELTTAGERAFGSCPYVVEANFPKLTTVPGSFMSSSGVITVNLPVAENIRGLGYCRTLENVNCPNAKIVNDYTFQSDSSLQKFDGVSVTSIGNGSFSSCSKFSTLILRNAEVICALANTNALNGTLVKSGTGYIYVPRTLLSDTDSTHDYRQATNWSTYAAQFRALEDYTVDGTVTGDLDPTKI